MHYKGYEFAPVAQALHSGLFSANLVIQDEISLLRPAFIFDGLDYFFEPDLALDYAALWARLWIDDRATCQASNRAFEIVHANHNRLEWKRHVGLVRGKRVKKYAKR